MIRRILVTSACAGLLALGPAAAASADAVPHADPVSDLLAGGGPGGLGGLLSDLLGGPGGLGGLLSNLLGGSGATGGAGGGLGELTATLDGGNIELPDLSATLK
ncbi:hypothetical protein Aph01nite_76200 [Acrocarpospora phusangensis]|uniref:ATP-binding protein n=1 Tax=Acrocarpospora phusangensis TaxID=1070424 RepID=A0A919QKU3_9ACTN|nr:hypothetical protein [Acrocarpospora phusangensis]GIH29310.1 hypothetical protein Aph01nite_76200 [Acrocarpospora phusangensis]